MATLVRRFGETPSKKATEVLWRKSRTPMPEIQSQRLAAHPLGENSPAKVCATRRVARFAGDDAGICV